MSLLKKLLAVLAVSVSTATIAAPLVVDAGWYGFCFGGPGSGSTQGCQNDGIDVTGNPITFTATGPVLLKVTDAFQVGDVFDVFINSLLAFTTSAPGAGPDGLTNPDLAFASGYFSAGSILLAAGVYTVDIIVAASPFNGGGAYIEAESVPIPGTLWLVAAGLGLLGVRRKLQH